MTSTWTYTRYELLRIVRNRQGFIFSLIFPLIMYFLLAGPNRNDHDFGGTKGHPTGIFAPQYYMVSLLGFGAIVAVTSGGARISSERTVGWNRQLRLTPLSPRRYLRTKILTGYALAGVGMLLLYAAGISFGVRMGASHWLAMTALILVALVPFAALGVGLGHLLREDAIGPVLGGGVSLFAFLGGSWFPITGGVLATICKLLPSYWLVQAGHVGLGGGNPWSVEGWVVIAAWSAAMIAFAGWAYRRDTGRG
jgi:ABC-2 type transport system permease protein